MQGTMGVHVHSGNEARHLSAHTCVPKNSRILGVAISLKSDLERVRS